MADGDLRGEVEDHLRPDVGQETGEIGVDDVGLDEFEVRVPVGLARLTLLPELRSSTPMTVCPSAEKAIDQVDPMNPAAPVTSVRIGPPYRRRSAP